MILHSWKTEKRRMLPHNHQKIDILVNVYSITAVRSSCCYIILPQQTKWALFTWVSLKVNSIEIMKLLQELYLPGYNTVQKVKLSLQQAIRL
jgi:hypothetical protein